jgi:hypothetical protein
MIGITGRTEQLPCIPMVVGLTPKAGPCHSRGLMAQEEETRGRMEETAPPGRMAGLAGMGRRRQAMARMDRTFTRVECGGEMVGTAGTRQPSEGMAGLERCRAMAAWRWRSVAGEAGPAHRNRQAGTQGAEETVDKEVPLTLMGEKRATTWEDQLGQPADPHMLLGETADGPVTA